jgi:hypothetical protein
MGQNGFTSSPRKTCWGFFFALKNPTASDGFEPKGQHATSRPPKPLQIGIWLPTFFLDCLAFEEGTDRFSRNIVKYQSTPRDVQKERESQLILSYKHEDGSLTLVETCSGSVKYLGVPGLWQRFVWYCRPLEMWCRITGWFSDGCFETTFRYIHGSVPLARITVRLKMSTVVKNRRVVLKFNFQTFICASINIQDW